MNFHPILVLICVYNKTAREDMRILPLTVSGWHEALKVRLKAQLWNPISDRQNTRTVRE